MFRAAFLIIFFRRAPPSCSFFTGLFRSTLVLDELFFSSLLSFALPPADYFSVFSAAAAFSTDVPH